MLCQDHFRPLGERERHPTPALRRAALPCPTRLPRCHHHTKHRPCSRRRSSTFCSSIPSRFLALAIKEIDISAALPNQQGQQIQAVAHGCPDPASRGPVDFGLTDGTSQADPVIRAFVVGSILCLAEVDAPLIHNMTAYTLDRLQTLLLQCGSMLWVTSGAYRCSDTPGTCKKNMTQGLLRTVRPETCKAPMELELAAADAGQWG